MANLKFEAPDISHSDAVDIADVTVKKLVKASSNIAYVLTSSPKFNDKIKEAAIVPVEAEGLIPSDGAILNKESVGALYDKISPSIEPFVGKWGVGEAEKLLQQSREIDMRYFAGVVAIVYSYYLLKMVQDKYNEIPANQVSKAKSYSLSTDSSGNVSINFVDGSGTKIEVETQGKPLYVIDGKKIIIKPSASAEPVTYEIVTEGVKLKVSDGGIIVSMGDAECLFAFEDSEMVIKTTSSGRKQLSETHEFNIIEGKEGLRKVKIVKKDHVEGPAVVSNTIDGLTPKAGKSFDNVGDLLGPLSLKASLSSMAVPKDLDFTKNGVDKLATQIGVFLRTMPSAKLNIDGLKIEMAKIFEGVDDESDFTGLLAKAAAIYYLQQVKDEFDKAYDPVRMNLIKDWKTNEKYAINYGLNIEGGAPTVTFNPSTEFTAAYEKTGVVEQTSTMSSEQQNSLVALKADPLISSLVGMSGGGDELLGKIIRKEPAGFFGFLIAIIAGIKGIGGFGNSWLAIKSYMPDQLKPMAEKAEKLVENGEKKFNELIDKDNDVIVGKFMDNGKREYTVATVFGIKGLVFAQDFEPSSRFECLQVTVGDNQEIVFGSDVSAGRIEQGNPATKYEVTDRKIGRPGKYKIYSKIPKGTKFGVGVKMKLIPKSDTTETVVDGAK